MFLTIVAVLLMQIRWGNSTIENYAMGFLTTSSIVGPIDDTANATVIFIRNGWNRVAKSFNTRFSNSLREENQPGTRLSGFQVGRSENIEPPSRSIGSKIKSHFIDETKTPGAHKVSSSHGAASETPAEDESIEE